MKHADANSFTQAPILLMFVISAATVMTTNAVQAKGPVIHISDVSHFYQMYDAAHGYPTAERLQRDYLEQGAPGLHHLAKIRRLTGKSIAKAIATYPQLYAHAGRRMAVLPRVRR